MFKFIKRLFFLVIILIFIVLFYYFKSAKFNWKENNLNLFKNFSSISKDFSERWKNILGKQEEYNMSAHMPKLLDGETVNKEKEEFNGTEDIIITLINKERFDKKLDPLKKNELLMKSALAKAMDMKQKKYFEHISDNKIQPWFFAENVGYQYESFGENIAINYLSANSVHKAFMDSVGHRKNILNKDFRDIGIAILAVEDNRDIKYIVVEHFGKYLKDIDIREGKYSNKIQLRCKVQKTKKKELKKMIKDEKEQIEENKKQNDKSNNLEILERELKSLEKIKEKINKYLDICEKLEEQDNNNNNNK